MGWLLEAVRVNTCDGDRLHRVCRVSLRYPVNVRAVCHSVLHVTSKVRVVVLDEVEDGAVWHCPCHTMCDMRHVELVVCEPAMRGQSRMVATRHALPSLRVN